MWVLSQAHPQAPLEAADDTIQQTHAARRLGCDVLHLPGRLRLDDVPSAFDGVDIEVPQPAIWFGYIPTQAVYAAVYEHAARRGLRLLNDPQEHHVAFEFDLAYPQLESLTPKTVVVRAVEDVEAAVAQVGFPAFVRGAMLSNKGKGRAACVAENVDQARALVGDLLAQEHLSRGRVLLRKFESLRTQSIAGFDFPAGREYRVFLYRGEVVAQRLLLAVLAGVRVARCAGDRGCVGFGSGGSSHRFAHAVAQAGRWRRPPMDGQQKRERDGDDPSVRSGLGLIHRRAKGTQPARRACRRMRR